MENKVKITIYENALAKIVATQEDWGVEVVFFGNFELADPAGIKSIIDWFDTVKNQSIYFDFRNTLSVDDGTIGLTLALKQIAAGQGGDFAVICSNNPANKIGAIFKAVSFNSSGAPNVPLKVLHSHHTFIMSAKTRVAQMQAAAASHGRGQAAP
jgi:hypothetical protein